MDVALIGEKTLRVKGKKASIIINPITGISKTEADAIVLTDSLPDFNDAKIEGSRITLKGTGEYEVGGIKVSLISAGDKKVAKLDVDNVTLVFGDGASIEKVKDKIEGSNVIVINADAEFNYSSLTSLETNVFIAYGKLKDEVGKALGKESTEPSSKFSTTVDKLPSEVQFVALS